MNQTQLNLLKFEYEVQHIETFLIGASGKAKINQYLSCSYYMRQYHVRPDQQAKNKHWLRLMIFRDFQFHRFAYF